MLSLWPAGSSNQTETSRMPVNHCLLNNNNDNDRDHYLLSSLTRDVAQVGLVVVVAWQKYLSILNYRRENSHGLAAMSLP